MDEGKEKRKKEVEAYWVQVANVIACVCVWAVDTNERDKKRKKKTDQVRILDVISCRHGCIACRRRWWWARTGVKK